MRKVLYILVFMLFSVTANGQTTTGSISGSVIDSTGNVIAGAKVSIINPATNYIQTTTTNEHGVFVVPQLQPASYVIIVEMTGFKKIEKTGIQLSAQDKLNAGVFSLELGQVTDTVTVQADAGQMQLKTESGERSEVITNSQLRDLALNGRTTLDLIKILPGVSGEFGGSTSGTGGQLRNYNVNGTRINTKEFTIDGATNIDVGDNGAVHVTVNPDAIAEVKVLTSNFQAEFGKAGGAFISFVTKGGTNDYHGGARYFRRHDSMNANTFSNNANGRPRELYRYNNYGWDVGGPVYLPKFGIGDTAFWKGQNKLFFFFNQEYYDQFIPGGVATLRLPTLAERNGDFSQTVDGNGNKIYVRDPKLALTDTVKCQATPASPVAGVKYQGACFPNNIIPTDRFYQYGQAILNLYPQPNFVGNTRYNYEFQGSNNYPRREDNLRIDFNINQSNRLSGRLTNNSDKQSRPFGGTFRGAQNLPLTYVQQNAPGQNISMSLNTNFSSSLVNEFGFGYSHGKIEIYAGDDKITRAGSGINIPQLFPDANTGDMIPDLGYGGAFNVQNMPATDYVIPFETNKYVYNIFDSLTWVRGSHTLKGGIFVQLSNNNNRPLVNHNGEISFASNSNNQFNTGHPYANALLGVINSYTQANNYPYYKYVYKNIEWYLQDTFRVNNRLTLDYGLRMAHYQPQYNATGVGSSFNPALFDQSKAVRLYVPTCLSGTSCAAANQRAIDPSKLVAGYVVKPGDLQPAAYIGAIVPGAGNLTNGLGLEKDGYPRAGFESAAVVLAPRVGFAYTLTKDLKTVLRGGFGASYDRMMGNISFGLGTNPPNIRPGGYYFGMLGDQNTVKDAPFTPPSVVGYSRDGNVPTIYSFSLGVQRDIGFKTVIDVAYVGTQGRHLSQRRNLNAIPYGTTFQRWAQDKTKIANFASIEKETGLPTAYSNAGYNFSGKNALPANLLRPFQGYGAINYTEFVGSSNYNSLQVSANRRFSDGLTFGVAYTWSKAFSTGDADDSVTHPFDTRKYSYKLADFDRTHVLAVNYSWHVPALGTKLSQNKIIRGALNGWQFSGITRRQNGTPYEVGISFASVDSGIRVTGSPDIAARFYLIGDPQVSKDGLLINPNAFVVPGIGQIDPTPNRYLRRPSFWNNDLSLFKNFYFSGDKKTFLQLRLEAFNVFNQVQFINVNTSTLISTASGSPAEADVFNNYNNLKVVPTLRTPRSILPTGNFFGEPSGARDPRIVQLAAKIYF